MPAEIRVIHAHQFVEATPEGDLDLMRTKAVLLEVAAATAPSAECDVILNTLDATSEMSVSDLWYLAAELHRFRDAFSKKTAVVAPSERFDHAGFFALCAQERGFDVRAFTTLGEAMAWLAESDDEVPAPIALWSGTAS